MTTTPAPAAPSTGKTIGLVLALAIGIPLAIVIAIAIAIWMRFFGPLPVVDDLTYGSSGPQCFQVSPEQYVIQVPIASKDGRTDLPDVSVSGSSSLSVSGAYVVPSGVSGFTRSTPPSAEAVEGWSEGYGDNAIREEGNLLLVVLERLGTADTVTAAGLEFIHHGGPENAFTESMAMPIEISGSNCEVSFIDGVDDAQVRGSR